MPQDNHIFCKCFEEPRNSQIRVNCCDKTNQATNFIFYMKFGCLKFQELDSESFDPKTTPRPLGHRPIYFNSNEFSYL